MQNGLTTPIGEAMFNADPLYSTILAFKRQRELLDASDEIANPKQDKAIEARFGRFLDRLATQTPPCTTDEGAIASLRFIADELERIGDYSDMHDAVLASVSAYVLNRHQRTYPGLKRA